MGGTIDKIYHHAGELEVGPPAASEILKGAGEVALVVNRRDGVEHLEISR